MKIRIVLEAKWFVRFISLRTLFHDLDVTFRGSHLGYLLATINFKSAHFWETYFDDVMNVVELEFQVGSNVLLASALVVKRNLLNMVRVI